MGIASSIQEMPERMAASQKEMQITMQERMRRVMISQQMALARERTWWFAGAALALIIAGVASKKHQLLIPVVPISVVGAFTFDMGYGTKINRVNAMHRDVLNDPRYFFHGTISDTEAVLYSSLVNDKSKN